MSGRPSDETDYYQPPRGGIAAAEANSPAQEPTPHTHRKQKLPGPAINPKKPPPLVTQFTKYSCWAAALESWLDVAGSMPRVNQEQITAQYPEETRSGFDIPQLRTMLSAWGMDTALMYYENFDTPHIKDAIAKRGPLYVGTRIHFSYWHAVALFDVEEPASNSKDLQPRYWVMNPGTGKVEAWLEKDFFEEGVGHPLVIGFKSIGPVGRLR